MLNLLFSLWLFAKCWNYQVDRVPVWQGTFGNWSAVFIRSLVAFIIIEMALLGVVLMLSNAL